MTVRIAGIVAFVLLRVASAGAQTQGKSDRDLVAAVDALVQPEADAGLLSGTILNLLQGAAAKGIVRLPPMVPRFEPAASFVGLYGPASDPVAVAEFDGNLLRDENEFYPIEGGRYCIPASGFVMWFRRDASGAVDAMVTIGGGVETLQPRIK